MRFLIFALLIITPLICNAQDSVDSTMSNGMSDTMNNGMDDTMSNGMSDTMSNDMGDNMSSGMDDTMNSTMNGTMNMSVAFDPMSFPTTALATFAVDIHLTSGNPTQQSLAFHYCAGLPNGQLQCDVYDGPSTNATLIGVELIISNATFAQLPANEKIFWHSHAFPILNGLFVIPNLPADQELGVLQSIIDTYGKVIHFQQANSSFPSGAPTLQYGVENMDQINQTIVDQFDSILGLNTTYQQRTQQRQGLVAQPVIQGAGNNGNASSYVQFVAQVFNS